MSVLLSEFDEYRKEFFERCDKIYKQRGEDYNRQTNIRKYFIYGVTSVFQLIWAKTLRLRSIMGYGRYEVLEDSDRLTFEDTLIDLVVYASFAYAENKCRIKEGYPHGYEPTTPSNTDVGNAQSTSGIVERVVLEQGSEGAPPLPRPADHEYNPVHEACPSCREYAERSRADYGRDNANVGDQSNTAKHAGTTSKDSSCSILRGGAPDRRQV